ncbi:hypothetical protein EJA72_20425, partial [Pseudomonas sp. PB120]|nr:hypothetical protein [Pseudomonas sp. PB120]
SLLAMDVNDNATCLEDRGVWVSIASRLAPTFDWGVLERDQSTVRPSSLASQLPQGECGHPQKPGRLSGRLALLLI